MPTVVKRAQVGVDEYQYLLSDGSSKVTTKWLEVGAEFHKRKPMEWSTQTRWVREEEVDESACEITDWGEYDNGEPNGWVEITYECNQFGKTRRPE